MNYDRDNIFAKILRSEMSCHQVYEDANTLAFLDIMPRCDGHTLVVPKAPARNLLDANPEILGDLMAVTQRISLAAKKAFSADGVIIQQFNEEAGGQVVFHLHFHVLPLANGQKLQPPGQMAEKELLLAHAERLKLVLERNTPS